MNFVHDDKYFGQLIRIVAQNHRIAEALIEKDYWVTHTLWAIHETGLEIWFKGGTSLSKGFRLIQRFSEDLDLIIQPGAAGSLPAVTNWTSTNKGPVAKRNAFYEELTQQLVVPGMRIERDTTRIDSRARSADYLGHYPGLLKAQLASAMSPFVRLEVGHARVVPQLTIPLSSFVHDYLEEKDQIGDYTENRPRAVRCVHPLMTLFEKLDAMTRRYERDAIEADSFVRHYEDAAQIILAIDELPELEMSAQDLVDDMLQKNNIGALPTPDDAALLLSDSDKRDVVERAHRKIAPMFWGERIELNDACRIIREWLKRQDWND
ncbi:MAG: nucleotidyl transferase AbiEii/AbiGii toxin family protein [Polyangiaceae bacterium]|nr:nucleotidyl transferase AbiEii/AbiGii toxin family protein [Polyangiaceae bacterium]